MSRLPRLEEHRFVGVRDTMRVYDCDVEGEYEALQLRMVRDQLIQSKLVQTFAPDTLLEAKNRGFRGLRA